MSSLVKSEISEVFSALEAMAACGITDKSLYIIRRFPVVRQRLMKPLAEATELLDKAQFGDGKPALAAARVIVRRFPDDELRYFLVMHAKSGQVKMWAMLRITDHRVLTRIMTSATTPLEIFEAGLLRFNDIVSLAPIRDRFNPDSEYRKLVEARIKTVTEGIWGSQ